jgi:transposase
VKRFLRRVAPPTPRATLRLEVDPGEEAQVDFGFGGLYRDPESDRLRRGWAFVMTLSCSRHQYAELAFDQSLATWLRLHRAAFEFFGGVPRRVVLDNLRAAIVHAALYDPEVQRSYREFAEHYGFLIAPCRPRTPEHKGKVEQGGVHYVKRNALAGRAFRDLHDGNRHLLRWCVENAGRRVHGTTRQIPLAVFDQVERAALQPVPFTPWELAEWKQAKLHPDCHVVFAGAYYSAPHRLIGQRLWVRATDVKVELYQEYVLVATHRRARPGQRRTLLAHLPPDKVHFLLQTPAWCRTRAADIGPACADFIERLLGDRPLDRLRSAQGVLRLGPRYSPARLDAACARALAVGEYRYHTVKTILAHALDGHPPAHSHTRRGRRPGDPGPARPPLDHLFPRPRCERGAVPMELTHQLTPMLRTLRLSGILETLDVRNRQAVEQQTSFVEFLTVLLQDEVERRAQSKLRLRLRRAAFDPTKTLEGFDFSFNPKLNKAQVFDLATCQFIERHENVLLYGPPESAT